MMYTDVKQPDRGPRAAGCLPQSAFVEGRFHVYRRAARRYAAPMSPRQHACRLTLSELEVLLDRHRPSWRAFARLVALGERDLTLEMPCHPDLLRAGGTIAGPALMTLADRAAYYLTLALAGPQVDAVTASLDIHFLARAAPEPVVATATMLRLGRRLTVSSVDLCSPAELVARATVSYALPPETR